MHLTQRNHEYVYPYLLIFQSFVVTASRKTARFALLFLFACSSMSATIHAQDINGSMNYGGKSRTYLLHLPEGYTGSQPLPIVFALHGLYFTGSKMKDLTGFNAIADAENFIAVYPDGINKHWAAPDGSVDDVGFISALIDELQSDYNVDENRIYAAGASNGGMFTYRLSLELADRIAAVAIVAGYMPAYGPLPSPTPARPISVIHFHGTSDGMIPYDRAESAADYWVEFDNCSAPPVTEFLPNLDLSDGTTVDEYIYPNGSENSEFTLYKINGGGHTWPGSESNTLPGVTTHDINASEIIWDFFKKHTLNGAPSNASPTVSLTTPLDGAIFTAPATFRIKATASDPDGTISKVDFYKGTELLKSDVTYKYGYEWTEVPAGTYTLYAVATDNDGATATSSSITITVKPAKLGEEVADESTVAVICDNLHQQLIIHKPVDIEHYDLSVYDLTGTEVMAMNNLQDMQKIVKVGSLQAGLYVYRVRVNDQSLNGRFVVVK